MIRDFLDREVEHGGDAPLLREAMADAGLIGIARMVLHSKEHLVALWESELVTRF